MARLSEKELVDILSKLPDIQRLDVQTAFGAREERLFFCALGFEERCLSIPEELASNVPDYRCHTAVFLEYATNKGDNDVNKPRLLQALSTFSQDVQSLPCDEDDFAQRLRLILSQARTESVVPRVTLDLSACSSKLLLLTLKVILEADVELLVVYSEADIYHPTEEEYDADPKKWTTEDSLGLARGVSRIIPSPEHPGMRQDQAPEAVIVFPTFKPERTRAVIANIDESLITRPRDRVIWIVGKPHLKNDGWRSQVMQKINDIPEAAPKRVVCTFDFKRTLEALESLYCQMDHRYRVTISPLGAKMQSLGVALFWHMHQDVSLVFAMPKEYNAAQYSEGRKATWMIDFGPTDVLRGVLDGLGQLQIVR